MATPRDAKRADWVAQRRKTVAKLSAKLAALTGLPAEELIERGLFRRGEPRQAVRVPDLGGAEITVRPGTSDVLVLLETLSGRYHLPPPGIEPGVILDLGSNIGATMAHFAHLYEDARVCGVELDAENAELCALNVARWGERCQVLHAAVAGSDGTGSYERTGGALGYKLGAGAERVRTMAIDSIFEHFGLDEVDYLKMDIEGAEREVLRDEDGGPSVCARSRSRCTSRPRWTRCWRT